MRWIPGLLAGVAGCAMVPIGRLPDSGKAVAVDGDAIFLNCESDPCQELWLHNGVQGRVEKKYMGAAESSERAEIAFRLKNDEVVVLFVKADGRWIVAPDTAVKVGGSNFRLHDSSAVLVVRGSPVPTRGAEVKEVSELQDAEIPGPHPPAPPGEPMAPPSGAPLKRAETKK